MGAIIDGINHIAEGWGKAVGKAVNIADNAVKEIEKGLFDGGATPSETVADAIGQTPRNEEAHYDPTANKEEISKAENEYTLEEEKYLQDRNALWEREDRIRGEVQSREDNAYQRMVEDMIKAGINPNLVSISGSGSSSGGGINGATIGDTTQKTQAQKNKQELKKQLLEQLFSDDQNVRDRAIKVMDALIGIIPG